MAYNVAVFERNQLWSVQVEKERAIERLTTKLNAEKKARREVERSRGGARADIKSLHRQLDIAKKDAADAESCLGIAMDTLHKLTKEKDEWKRTQLQMTIDMEKLSHDNRRLRAAEGQRDAEVHMMIDMEKLSHDNRRLQAAEGQRDAEVQTLRAAKDKAEHAMAALQAELATIKMECQLAISAVNKYKCSLADADTENQRLVQELEKGQSLAHANVKRLLHRFREATTAKIQACTANALKEWCEQAAKLQLLQVDKANRELRGPGFRKLDKTNCEDAQQNLTQDFMRIAMRYRKEVELMLEQHDKLVAELRTDLEAVTEPIVSASRDQAITVEDDEDEETEAEPSILGVLTED
jgi:chromosome segregation ATPase